LGVINTLAYFKNLSIIAVKSFIGMAPRKKIIFLY
jgi:hypothetical protein